MKNRIVVMGLPRCGSSLMMRMIRNGGGKIYYEEDHSFETANILLRGQWSWLSELEEGMAFKHIELQINPLPLTNPHPFPMEKRVDDDYLFHCIWLSRDYTEQAKSQLKLLWLLNGIPIDRSRKSIRQMAKSIERDTGKCLRQLEAQHNCRTYHLSFETLISEFERSSESISLFLEDVVKLDPVRMYQTVLRRDAKCAPDMEIENMDVNG